MGYGRGQRSKVKKQCSKTSLDVPAAAGRLLEGVPVCMHNLSAVLASSKLMYMKHNTTALAVTK